MKNYSFNMPGFEIQKEERENSRQLVNRFIRRLRKSGILYRAKKSMYRERPLSRKLKKRAALRREEIKRRYQEQEKLGRF
jgi:ribosomal protein S21